MFAASPEKRDVILAELLINVLQLLEFGALVRGRRGSRGRSGGSGHLGRSEIVNGRWKKGLASQSFKGAMNKVLQ